MEASNRFQPDPNYEAPPEPEPELPGVAPEQALADAAETAENFLVFCETCGAKRVVETADTHPAACSKGAKCKAPTHVLQVNV